MIFILVLTHLDSFSQQLSDIEIKKIIGENIFFQNENINNYEFKILTYQNRNNDTSFITFDIKSTTEWNKANMPVSGNFNGMIIKNKKFYMHGTFTQVIVNRNNTPVSTNGTYLFDKLNGVVGIRTPDYFLSKTNYLNGLKNGLFISYYGTKEENINQLYFYLNDTINGNSYEFYPNGVIKEEIEFNMGKRQGLYKSYYETGSIKWKKNYTKDILKGRAIEYYSNGKIRSTGEYSGNYYNVQVECDTCSPLRFVFRKPSGSIIDVFKTFSIESKKEIGIEMRTWGLKEKIKFSIKKGLWLYYNEDGVLSKKLVFDNLGNAK